MLISLIITIVIGLIIGYFYYCLQKKDEQKGYLLSGVFEKHRVNPNEIFTIQFGNMKIMASYNDIVNGINLRKWVEFGYDYPMSIKIDNGNLMVSASFNDKKGKMIAQIIDNQWVINRDNYCDRNFSRNTLEVVDKEKIPLLQVDIKDGNNIFIGGAFYFPTIRLFMSDGNSTITGDSAFNDAVALRKIKRIFKYPGNANLGIKE